MTKWARRAIGGWCRGPWTVRPIIGARRPMFWLYHDHNRYAPTGRYDDVVSFHSARDAMRYADGLTSKVEPR